MESYQKELSRIRALLKAHPHGLTVTDIAKKIDINRNSIAKYLDILLISGQVEKRVVGKAKVYSLSHRVPISAILSLSSDAIVIVDQKKRVLHANSTFLEWEHLTPSEVIGWNIDDLHLSLFPSACVAENYDLVINGQEHSSEVPLIKDGKASFYRIKCVPTVFEDSTRGVTAIFEDITPQKVHQQTLEMSEALYRAVVEDQTELICRFLPNRLHVFANEAYCRYFGRKRDEILKLRFFPDIQREDRKSLSNYFSALSPERPVSTIETRMQCQDKGLRWLRWNIRGFFDKDGRVMEYQAVGSDITEQKEREDSRRQSEQRLAGIINFLPDATVAIDRNGRVIAWNRAIEEMTGVPAEEMIGKGDYEYALPFYGHRRPILIDLVTREDEGVKELYNYIHREGVVYIAESDSPRPKGKKVVLWGKAAPLYDKEGRLIGAIQTIRDITALKRTESALREDKEKYRQLVESAEEGIWAIDRSGHTTYLNPRMAEILGYPIKDILGMEFLGFIYDKERSLAENNISRCRRGMKERFEMHLVRQNGDMVLARITASPVTDEREKYLGALIAVTDITRERREEDLLMLTEDRYESLVRRFQGVTFRTDFDFQPFSVRGDVEAIIGYTADEVLKDKPSWINIVHLEDAPRVIERIKDLATDSSLSTEISYRVNRRDGVTRIVDVILYPICDTTGRPVAVGGALFDVTEGQSSPVSNPQ